MDVPARARSEQPRCAPAACHDRRQEVGVALNQHGPLVEAIDIGPTGLAQGAAEDGITEEAVERSLELASRR